MIKSLVNWEPYRPFTVGFDSLWDRLETLELDVPNYPPYNIRKIDDLKYSIDLALAGFDKKDISDVVEVLKSDNLTQGKFNSKFENKLKSYFGARYCEDVSYSHRRVIPSVE